MDAGATTTELLRPYLPRLLLQWVSSTPEQHWQALEGTVAFVDISGFTKLSERLAKRGKVGAEELTDAIGTCFTRLLAVAYGNGGSLIKFGGDALLLFFSGAGHEQKACRAAVGMRHELRDIGKMDCQGVPVTLRMSVGVHSGTFHFFLVGDSHRELIITGPAASETVLMESIAEAGEIVVSHATASAIPTQCLGAAKGAGMLLKREPIGITPERPAPERGIDEAELVRSVPVAVRERLLAGTREAEHRRVTIAFIHFDGVDELMNSEGPQAIAEHIGVLVRDVQHAVDHHGVAFLASDIDRDGGKIILSAGAPESGGNDEERMLLALREIVDGERRIPIRVGVNRGHVFAGDIGPFYRRTYTVMGDAVNLSARLMAKAAAGQILSTQGVLELSRTTFESVEMEPFLVKGKARPVRASRVGGVLGSRREDAAGRTPLIGREDEVAALMAGLDSARRREGRTIEIVAEPGLGKSRLLEEARARAGDAVVIDAACELYESSTPYGSFRRPFRTVLGIAREAPPAQAEARLNEVLTALAPELRPWAPLIAIVLDVEIPATPETAALEDRFRRPKLNEVVGELMARLLRTTTMLVFEDVHWMDEASADLLGHLVRGVETQPWLIVASRRDTGEGFSAPEGSAATRLDLQPLDANKSAEMLTAATEGTPFRPDEIATLAERSGGNPLFLKELLVAAKAGGLESLPDSVEALIVSRIDRLAPPDRNLLRRASVLGRSFSPELLVAVLNGETPDASTWDRLGGFMMRDDSGTLSFVHALIRDGAYEGLPYRLRRSLHAQVGETIEKRAGDSPDDEAELLSLHFFYAQRYAEAWRYSLVAAERARAIYANVESAGFYERSLDAARHVGDLVPLEVARVREALGDIRNTMGAYREAGQAYQAVRRMVADDPIAEARLMLKLSWCQAWLSRHSHALRWITRGLRLLQGIEGAEASHQRAELLVRYARYLQEQGRHERAIEWCRKAIDEAQRHGNRKALADAYRFLDWAYADLGQLDKATYSRDSLAVYEELGDLAGQCMVLNNLGTFAFWESRWSEALDLWGRAEEMANKVGNPVDAALCTNNIGEILADQGKLEEAEARIRDAMRVYQAVGNTTGSAYSKTRLGAVAARAGRFDEAMRLIEEGRKGSQGVGAEVDVLEADVRLAECYLLRGDGRHALEKAEEGTARAVALGGVAVQTPMLQRIKGHALIQLGELQDARQAFEESLAAGRARGADYDIALTLRGLVQLSRLEDAPAPMDSEKEAESTLERLGVVWLPEIPFEARVSVSASRNT